MSITLTFNAERREVWRQQGLWGDASLGDYWNQTARAMPDKIAVVDNHGASYTYAALDSAASSLATWFLACGIQPGDRIAFQLPGWCEFTIIYLAGLKTGAVSVPLLPAWRELALQGAGGVMDVSDASQAWSVAVRPLTDHSGRELASLAVLRDVADRKSTRLNSSHT